MSSLDDHPTVRRLRAGGAQLAPNRAGVRRG